MSKLYPTRCNCIFSCSTYRQSAERFCAAVWHVSWKWIFALSSPRRWRSSDLWCAWSLSIWGGEQITNNGNSLIGRERDCTLAAVAFTLVPPIGWRQRWCSAPVATAPPNRHPIRPPAEWHCTWMQCAIDRRIVQFSSCATFSAERERDADWAVDQPSVVGRHPSTWHPSWVQIVTCYCADW